MFRINTTIVRHAPALLRTASGLLGGGLVFIGARFLVAPDAGAVGFGLPPSTDGWYALHYTKGIRDVFSGLVIGTFAVAGWHKPLAAVLALGAMIPAVDFTIVLTTPGANLRAAPIHGVTVVVALLLAGGVWRMAPGRPTSR